MDSILTGAERQILHHLQVVAAELHHTAQRTRCRYLTAHLPIADGSTLVFTYEDGEMTVTGAGFEGPLPAVPPNRG
jgi:hypothetical protein